MALLGLRATVGEVLGLGWATVILTVCAIALTIGFGILVARWLRLDERFGVLSGGAVSICGAPAALAISTVLPRSEQSQRDAGFVVISVTLLSSPRDRHGAAQRRRRAAERWTAIPWFVIAFGVLVIVTSAGWLPAPVVEAGKSVSAWFLVTAMAAIGLKTSLRSLAQVGGRALLLVVAETVFLAILALFFLR